MAFVFAHLPLQLILKAIEKITHKSAESSNKSAISAELGK